MKPSIAGGLLVLLAAAGVAGALPGRAIAAEPPAPGLTLAGQWSGPDWGDVVIEPDGSGSYTDTFQTGPGRLQLRATGPRSYAGTWGESAQRHGTLVLVLAPDGRTVTGTWTPDPQSTLGSQSGGAITWTRR